MLFEVAPGLWVRPEQVMAIRTTREHHGTGTLVLKPAVHIHLPGCGEIGWEFADWDHAKAWAENIATLVNAALQGSENSPYRT